MWNLENTAQSNLRARHFYTFWQIGLQLKPTTNAVHAYLYYVANVSLTLMPCNSIKITIRQFNFVLPWNS